MGKKGHNEIKNKEVRSQMYQKLKKEKLKEKKKHKLENKDKPKQTPKTIENCRIVDETFVNDINNDPELQLDLRTDEISKHLYGRTSDGKETIKTDDEEEKQEEEGQEEDDEQKIEDYESKLDKKETEEEELDEDDDTEDDDDDDDDDNKDPKILITTHELKISFQTYKLCRELARILPNANYFYRKNLRLSKVIPEAIKRKYSAMIVINEDRKIPNGMLISLLPEGPTMNFKLTNVKLSDEIKNGGGFTRHKPEIMLNNFNTRLGLQIGRSFAALFPHDPQYAGRHVITFHNQRDFVFFRHHRYIFRNAQKVGIQELGPSFTLKLRSLQKGTFNSKFGEYEWVHKIKLVGLNCVEMNSVIELQDDSEFTTHLGEAGAKLVVVDFSATWCGPCTMIAPFFKQLSVQYPSAVFIKVDVDKCPGTAAANNVTAMPTFIFYRNRVILDKLRGANKAELENKIKQLIQQQQESESTETSTNGTTNSGADGEFIDLVGLINKSQSECLNQDDDHTWEHCLTPSTTTFLQSDVDEQLLLHISFQQAVKINSLVIQGPEDNGPKDVKIFINQTRTLDFDSATSNQALQTLELKPEDLKDNSLIKLRFVKFQNVQSITFFFVNNQSSSEQTVINYLRLNGAPLSVTNMSEFKRVSGQAGESHG